MGDMVPGTYEDAFTVRCMEVTRHGAVRVETLFDYFQEVACVHADRLGCGCAELAKSGQAWVLLRIRMDEPKSGYNDLYDGDMVEVATPSDRYPDSRERGNLIYTEGKYEILTYGFGLDASFGYRDVMEMLDWAQTRLLHANEPVVVIEDYPNYRTCKVHVMRVPGHIARFTTPCCTLEELEEDWKP